MSFILGFLGLLRVSNLAVDNGNSLDPSRHILIKDCQLSKTSLTINLKWSKGNQLGTDIVSLPRTKDPLFCPVTNWDLYIDSLRPHYLHQDWPWLVHRQDGHTFWPSRDDVRALHNYVWEMANLTAAAYTPHSLRRGGATFFAESGLPLEDIKRLGLWQSDAIKFYLKLLNFSHSHLYKFLQDL